MFRKKDMDRSMALAEMTTHNLTQTANTEQEFRSAEAQVWAINSKQQLEGQSKGVA